MARLLSPQEQALWRRVTADVRHAKAADAPDVPVEAPILLPKGNPLRVPDVPRQLPPPARTPMSATLDARWDRQLRRGLAVPDRIVDLHGLTAGAAHARAVSAIDAAAAEGERMVLLITGKAPTVASSRIDLPIRGIIRASIGDWLAAHPVASRIAAIRPAHRCHGGAGALYVVLRRNK